MDTKKQGSKSSHAYVVSLACFFLAVAVIFYTIKFYSNGFSSDPSSWALFGDFLGGVGNPILGLLTIFLLAATLAQTSEALDISRNELELTRKALVNGIAIQEATEKALEEQIKLAQRKSEFETATTLVNHYGVEIERLKLAIADANEHPGLMTTMIPSMQADLIQKGSMHKQLADILEGEAIEIIRALQIKEGVIDPE